MNLKRIWRHILMSEIQVKRCFPEAVLNGIQSAVQQSETTHSGEICFVVEGELTWAQLLGDMTPRARALEVFSGMRVWDTEHNNGVLIYVLLADRIVEIVADRGIHRHAGDEVWRDICKSIQAEFRAGRFEDGGVKGVTAISAMLRKHFPADGKISNELSDRPVLI
jgi:uncharacterized membrane protein